jgi:hypothetical protein
MSTLVQALHVLQSREKVGLSRELLSISSNNISDLITISFDSPIFQLFQLHADFRFPRRVAGAKLIRDSVPIINNSKWEITFTATGLTRRLAVKEVTRSKYLLLGVR